jgi:FixJ family two-component response regulator
LPEASVISPTESKLHVCVVDGDAAVRDSLATLMALNGHEVSTYATGGDFLAALNGRAIDCVVCEAELPDSSGVELYQALKRKYPSARFALLVSRNDRATTASARSSGVDAVFHKPLVHRNLNRFVAFGNYG